MIKLLFDFDIKDFGGNKMAESGKFLATHIANASVADVLKYYDWASSMYKAEAIAVDESDFKKLYGFIEGHETITILVKAQLLRYMNKAKEDQYKITDLTYVSTAQ